MVLFQTHLNAELSPRQSCLLEIWACLMRANGISTQTGQIVLFRTHRTNLQDWYSQHLLSHMSPQCVRQWSSHLFSKPCKICSEFHRPLKLRVCALWFGSLWNQALHCFEGTLRFDPDWHLWGYLLACLEFTCIRPKASFWLLWVQIQSLDLKPCLNWVLDQQQLSNLPFQDMNSHLSQVWWRRLS